MWKMRLGRDGRYEGFGGSCYMGLRTWRMISGSIDS